MTALVVVVMVVVLVLVVLVLVLVLLLLLMMMMSGLQVKYISCKKVVSHKGVLKATLNSA